MLTYTYTAKDAKTGEKVSSFVEADDEQAAAKLLRQEGLTPIDIKVQGGGFSPLGKFGNKVKSKDKIIFARQLSTLINAGLPLVQSLRNVASTTPSKPLVVVLNRIIADVEGGMAFSKALEKHPGVFSNIFTNLVAAGEASGTLDQALERIANQQEKDAEVLSKVRGALAYPAIVIVVMVLVVGFMVVSLLPQVEGIYKTIPGVNLPITTRALLAVSHFVTKRWYILVIAMGLIVFFTSRWARSLGGKRFIDKAKMKAWPFGALFMKLYMARFARTGTTLVASGVPLIQVLEITGRAINNMHIEASLSRAIEKVKGGKALSASLEGDPNFLPLVPNMLRIGEESGALEQMLAKMADYYEKEVDQQIKTISTLIEPLLMVVLGVVVLVIVSAILLPIYGLVGKDFVTH